MNFYIGSSLRMLLLFTLLFGFAYPGIITLINQAVFPLQSQGSFIRGKDGTLMGSSLIGQNFSDPKYFWGRLSATSPQPYNANNSGGSNLGAANPALLDAVKARIADLQKADPENKQPIPVDLITASGSGLDPHISPQAADYQAARVARARKLGEKQVHDLIEEYTESRQFGVLGEPRVNVLLLNLALDGKI